MADKETATRKEQRPVIGFYVFMGLVVLTLVIIIGYVMKSYFIG
jgi:hypothetical protein